MKQYSRDEIISLCHEAKPEDFLDYQPHGNKVLRLCEHRVVKFGWHLSDQEARNIAMAHALLDNRIVRVPQVYEYFQDTNNCGYIVMDFMHGQQSSTMTDESQLKALSMVLQHFATHKSIEPGPLGGGPSAALIFGEEDYPTFESREHLDEWFSHRLLDPARKICLSQFDFVLCHLDLFPRNILWQENEPPAIVDWASAGYYPQVLERCVYRTIGIEEDLQLFCPMTSAEKEQMDMVLRAWGNMIRYCLYDTTFFAWLKLTRTAQNHDTKRQILSETPTSSFLYIQPLRLPIADKFAKSKTWPENIDHNTWSSNTTIIFLMGL